MTRLFFSPSPYYHLIIGTRTDRKGKVERHNQRMAVTLQQSVSERVGDLGRCFDVLQASQSAVFASQRQTRSELDKAQNALLSDVNKQIQAAVAQFQQFSAQITSELQSRNDSENKSLDQINKVP